MPTQVWKCDFCLEFHNTQYTADIHEGECEFNPFNRSCYSCANLYDYDVIEYCRIRKQVSYEILEPYADCNEFNCPLWRGGKSS